MTGPGWLLVLVLAFAADEPLPPGGDFEEWKGGSPAGWTVSIGATSPGTLDSEVGPGPEGGILLRAFPSRRARRVSCARGRSSTTPGSASRSSTQKDASPSVPSPPSTP